jgi:polyisoprenyl-teichoic acid--peptidoglycan teichoic acid transferase
MTDQYEYSEPRPNPLTRRRKRAPLWVRLVKATLLTLLFLLVIAVGGAMGYMGLGFKDASQLGTMGANLVYTRITRKPPFNGAKHINLLVMGADVAFDNSARTDTIKLFSINVDPPRVSVLSIPRDTWVAIPGHGHGRINSVYQMGAPTEKGDVNKFKRMSATRDVVVNLLSELSGERIVVDRMLRLQVEGFVKIVDALGGIDIDVEKQMDYDDPSQDLHIHLKPGMQHLDGYNAMCYVRYRHDAESDYGRIRRQDQFLAALSTKVSNMDHGTVARLVGPMLQAVRTDLSAADLLALKQIAANSGGTSGMYAARLPTVSVRIGGAAVEEVQDTEAAARIIRDVLNGPRPTVNIMSSATNTHLADTVVHTLNPEVYNVLTTPITAKAPDSSVIYANAHYAEAARALGVELGITTVDTTNPPPTPKLSRHQRPPPVANLTVVLTNSYQLPADAGSPTY